MGIALHDLERGAKVAEIWDEKGRPLPTRRLGVIVKVNFQTPEDTQGDVKSIEVEFGDGKPRTYFGTAQLCLHQKADMAALEKVLESAQNRVAVDGRKAPKMTDALGVGQTQKIAPNDPDMGLRRK